MTVIGMLEDEWRQVGATAAACAGLGRRAVAEPALRAWASPAELVRELGGPDMGLAPGVLGALLRSGDDPLAARTMLQAVLPGVKGVLARGFNGQRLGLAHQRDADAELVGATLGGHPRPCR